MAALIPRGFKLSLLGLCRRLGASCLFALLIPAAMADAGWVESGNLQLRTDLALLSDAGVIRLPMSHWPIPRAGVRQALAEAKEHAAINHAVSMALARVQARFANHVQPAGLQLAATLTAGEPPVLRHFATPAREVAEAGVSAQVDGERYSALLSVSGAADPADDQQLRVDGSHVTVRLGNWLLSAGAPERFWGPSHESSLILSNNARPMPTLTLERATAAPFDLPILEWLGPWRFTLGLSRMEGERQDIDAPLFMAWRISVLPSDSIELGFSRTAQFCGKQLACDFSSITEMLIGNDNVGIDASEANEPGNQMAGFDIRWSSPIGNLPYAIYSQMIGEDESGFLPAKYLAQFGVEGWKPLRDGGIVRVFAEYADTTCSANRDPPRYGCAYNQNRFDVEGYRYRGRALGHTTDRDAASYALGTIYNAANGQTWNATARSVRLNRDPAFDPNNSVTPLPADYEALEAGWRGSLFGAEVSVLLGLESFVPAGGERDLEPMGFVSWRHSFAR